MSAEQINQLSSYAAFGILGILLTALIVAAVLARWGDRRAHPIYADQVDDHGTETYLGQIVVVDETYSMADVASRWKETPDEGLELPETSFHPVVNVDDTLMIASTCIDVNGNPHSGMS